MSNNLIVEREKGLRRARAAHRRTARRPSAAQPLDMSNEIAALEAEVSADPHRSSSERCRRGRRSTWRAIPAGRPRSTISPRFDRFDELHGDRHFRDDPSIVGGFALLRGAPRHGDRPAARARYEREPAPQLRHAGAGRLSQGDPSRTPGLAICGLPIVTFVDTKGADPGISSEEHAQSEAIAMCLQAFATATVPIVATVIGEGGSGGALALAIADRVIMLEHSTYSVASPEGCAAILWSDASKAEEAAAALKLTAEDLDRFGIIDEIVPEPLGGAHRDPRRRRDADARCRRSCGDTLSSAVAGDGSWRSVIENTGAMGEWQARRSRTHRMAR